MDVLNVTAKKVDDTSIYALDYFPFNPIQGTQYNTPGIIKLIFKIKMSIFYLIKAGCNLIWFLRKAQMLDGRAPRTLLSSTML